MKIPPGLYDVSCSEYKEHRYEQLVQGEYQENICGICGEIADFIKKEEEEEEEKE